MPSSRVSKSKRTIRYAVVGLGNITQVAVLPGFKNATRNSVLAALVSGDEEKRQELSKRFEVPSYSYEEFEACLGAENIDAVYIAVPNSEHLEFVERAAAAKVHALCEKPLGVSEDECQRMIRACDDAGVRLMTAYRLHFDRVNLRIIEQIQAGAIGDLRMFNSTFSMQVREGDIRTQRDLGGGPVWDIGIYCINAARYLFRSEPTEVVAFAETVKGDPRFNEIDATVSAMLRFPDQRIATFVCSFGAASVDSFRIVGDKGDIQVDTPYSYHNERKVTETIEDKTRRKNYSKSDQFGPELLYFSDCLIEGTKPEPDGVEGLADVRIIEAIHKSIAEGTPVHLGPFERKQRPDRDQEIHKKPVRVQKPVNSPSPSES